MQQIILLLRTVDVVILLVKLTVYHVLISGNKNFILRGFYFSSAPFIIAKVFKNKVLFPIWLPVCKMIFFFFLQVDISYYTFFLLVNLVFMKHDACNGWLKPGKTEKKRWWTSFWDIFSNIVPFCPTISLSVFTVTYDVSMVHYKFTIRKICFYFGERRLRNPIWNMITSPMDSSPLDVEKGGWVCHLLKVAETMWCQRMMSKYLSTSAQFWAAITWLNFPVSSPGDSNILN